MQFPTKILINGQLVDGEGSEESVLNPATGEVLTNIPEASIPQVELAVAKAELAFLKWSRTTPKERSQLMLKLADKVLQARGANNVLAGAHPREELLCLGIGAVVDHAGEAIALSVEHQVLAHHTETDQAEMGLIHGALKTDPMSPVWRRL